MSESEHKQYEQMAECLVGFRGGTMRLGDLVDRLPELLKGIDHLDETWKETFVSYWWTLEQIHGAAIELGESRRMPTDTRKTVDDAITGLDKLVSEAIAAS